MDRCRCPEYAEAVKKLRFYTVGTHKPDKIDNYDRYGFDVLLVLSWSSCIRSLARLRYDGFEKGLKREKDFVKKPVWWTGFSVSWIKHGVDYEDMKFSKPKARVIYPDHQLPENLLPKECRKIEQMWCPFMTPFKVTVD